MNYSLNLPGCLFVPPRATLMGLLWLIVLSIGQPLYARESIDLAWAIQQTLNHNPELTAYPYQLRSAEALKLQAGLRPRPRLGFSVENALGNGEHRAIDNAEITLSLSQIIEMGNKRQQRIRFASAKVQRQQAEYELARLDILAETSRRYYQLLRLQALQDAISRRTRQERQALEIIRRRAEAGAAGKADVSKMSLRLARSESQAHRLADELVLAKSRLAAMWLDQPDFNSVRGNLLNTPAVPDKQTLIQNLEQSPAFIQQMALQRLADARLQLAKANGKSNLDVGIGVRQLETTNDQALTFSLSMPLAFSNPNRGRIAAALSEQELTRAQTDLKRNQLQLALLEIRQSLNLQLNQAKRLDQALLPQARTLLEDTGAGYETGRYSVLQWADAQAELFSLEREQIEIHTRIYLQLLELERITAQPMTNAGQGETL